MAITYEGVFAESQEVKVTAQKKPSIFAGPNLIDEDNKSINDTTQFVGKKFKIWGKLAENIEPYPGLPGRTVKIMRKLDTGAYAVFDTVTTDSAGLIPVKWYTLTDVGVNTFKLVFDGDSLYSGCSKEAKTFAKMRAR